MRGSLVAVASLVALALAGCGSTPDGYVYPPDSTLPNVLSMDIDTDATIDPTSVMAGKGIDVLVEYRAGGDWHVVTTCDTDASGYACRWDLVASVAPGGKLDVTDATSELERDDQVLTIDDRAVRLIFQTDTDVDGVHLQSAAGDTLRLDVVLDGFLDDPAHIRWSSGGKAAEAGSNPVDLTGTTP